MVIIVVSFVLVDKPPKKFSFYACSFGDSIRDITPNVAFGDLLLVRQYYECHLQVQAMSTQCHLNVLSILFFGCTWREHCLHVISWSHLERTLLTCCFLIALRYNIIVS